MDENEVARVARDVLKRVVEGLAKGDRYYDRLGRLLTTPQEILECLAREHKVKVEMSEPWNAAGNEFRLTAFRVKPSFGAQAPDDLESR